jgi:hypothetical protein
MSPLAKVAHHKTGGATGRSMWTTLRKMEQKQRANVHDTAPARYPGFQFVFHRVSTGQTTDDPRMGLGRIATDSRPCRG